MRTAEVATFLYHDVGAPGISGFQRRAAMPYKYSVADFTRHLGEIAASQHQPELVTEIDLQNRRRHLMLTFDDGGTSALTISEELNARGWKGHFFVVTSLIGSPRFLDTSAIRYIRSCGHLIGSHSHTHPDIFRAQKMEQMIQEWRVSCEKLSDLLSETCLAASVPGGDISDEVLQSAADSGLRYLFTSEPCLAPQRRGDCWVLGRVCPKNGTLPARIRELAHFRGWKSEMMVRRAKRAAKIILFPLYKGHVRRTTAE